MQYLVEVPYASMGNSLVTNWKEDPTPAFLVSKRSKSHQFLAIAFCMNSQQTFRKKIYKRGHFKWLASPSNWQFSRIFFSSFLSKVGLDSSILIVHALNTKRSFYPEKSHVKRASVCIALLYDSFVKYGKSSEKSLQMSQLYNLCKEKWILYRWFCRIL